MATDTEPATEQTGMSDLEALRTSILAGIDMKLSQKEEAMWKRGLKEIRRLQCEQQEVTTVVSDLQEKQDALVAENKQLRAALCEVTAKFEQVVNEMRQALRQLPHSAGHASPSPSVASTAASDVASPGLGGLVLHAPELAQGRVHIVHLEHALQRYKHFPEAFAEAWQKLAIIQDKARLVIEINDLIENRLEMSSKVDDPCDECHRLFAQYEDALRKFQKAALSVLEAQSTRRTTQDESFTEPTPPSSQGKTSLTLGMTPTWPTCAADDAGESFCTPLRASVASEDQALLNEACWPTWQNQHHPSPVFPGMICQAPAASAPLVPSPAVLSLASALTVAPTSYTSPPVASSPGSLSATTAGGLKQLQLAECLVEPRVHGGSSLQLPAVGSAASAQPLVAGQHQSAASAACWQNTTTHYGTPQLGLLRVELHKEPGFTTLGMEVNEVCDSTALQVQSIDEHGLVGRYNLSQSSETTTVQVGDMIVEVNGVSGEPHAMLQECKAQQQLVLIVSRGRDPVLSPSASSVPSPGAAQGGSLGDLSGGIHASHCTADAGELDRVLAEVAAPPVSWGRLRPEARVFVPFSAQVSENQASADLEVKDPQAEASTSDHPIDSPPAAAFAHCVTACGEDGVARALFP